MSQENLDNLQNADGNSTPEQEEVKNIVSQENAPNVEETKVDDTIESKEEESSSIDVVAKDATETVVEEAEEASDAEETVKEVKEIPILNYSKMTTDELYDEANKLVNGEAVQSIKQHIDQIREQFYELINKDKKEKEEAFLAEGGNVIDFRYESYIKNQFNSVYNDYRKKRDSFYKVIEDQQSKNYEYRLGLIDELKHLINKEEKMSDTFKEFRDIQDKWSSAGQVPKAKSSDLWRNYHHHIENFYDYLRLNNEMRDLDFKHNLEEKIKIVERAEYLVNESSIKVAFDELQLLHRLWKEETGPVAKEYRDAIWDRFSNATKIIHDRRHEHMKELKSEWTEHLTAKEEICKSIVEIASEDGNSHSQWQSRIKRIEGLKKEFQTVGRVAKSHNDEIWQKFKDATRVFNKKKNDFYKGLKKEQIDNLEKKLKFVDLAESLKDSEDWKETTETLKRIQSDWKKIGHVPKAQSDEIWNKFRGACNHFFDRLTENRKGKDSELITNFEEKSKLFEVVDKVELPSDTKEAVALLKEYINKWKMIGSVPRDKRSIENQFNNLIDKLFDKLDLDKNETALIKFKNRIESFLASDEMNKVYHERDVIRKKMDEIRKEVSQLDNNLGFFNVSPDNPLVKDVTRKIDRLKENLSLWKKKLDYLRSI
ncbi:MAG: DUF349 domain-containing protein [Flavobacteriales bacterium]|nr:DUF349 domain-containing protein [Flavobacteriales bacterium]